MSLTTDDEERVLPTVITSSKSFPLQIQIFIQFSAPNKVRPGFCPCTDQLRSYYLCALQIMNISHMSSSSCFISSKQAQACNIWPECSYACADVCAVFYKHATNQLDL